MILDSPSNITWGQRRWFQFWGLSANMRRWQWWSGVSLGIKRYSAAIKRAWSVLTKAWRPDRLIISILILDADRKLCHLMVVVVVVVVVGGGGGAWSSFDVIVFNRFLYIPWVRQLQIYMYGNTDKNSDTPSYVKIILVLWHLCTWQPLFRICPSVGLATISRVSMYANHGKYLYDLLGFGKMK